MGDSVATTGTNSTRSLVESEDEGFEIRFESTFLDTQNEEDVRKKLAGKRLEPVFKNSCIAPYKYDRCHL